MSQDYYRDLYRRPDGSVGWVETTLPQMHVRAFQGVNGVGVVLVWRDMDTDRVCWESESGLFSQMRGGRAMGNFPCCFDEKGGIYVQHDTSGALTRYNWDGEPTGTIPAPYSAEGIWSVRSDGTVVMRNDPSRFRYVGSEFWHNITETENYIVGQFGRDPDYGGSLSCYDKRTGKVTRWLGYTPHAPVALEDASGKLWVAISGQDTPAPDAVVWADDFPALPERPAPALPAIDFPPSVRPIWRGALGWELGSPGYFGGDRNSPDRPIVEGAIADWITPANESRLIGLWTSKHESADWAAEFANTVAVAKRSGAPVILYADRAMFDLWAEATAFQQAGCETMFCVRGYPIGPTDTVEAVMDRVDTQVRGFGVLANVVIVRPLYTQTGYWPAQLIAHINMALTDYIETHHQVVMDVAFGYDRKQEPTGAHAWLRTYFAGLCERTTQPSLDMLPRTVTPKPEPPAPVEPPKVESKPSKVRPWERPKGSGTGSKVAIGAAGLAGLIAALAAIFG